MTISIDHRPTHGGALSSERRRDKQVERARHRRLFDSIRRDPNPLELAGGLYTSLTFLRTRETTGGRYVFSKVVVPPGSGPIPHLHQWNDEWFYTPDGGAVMFMGSRRYPDFDVPPNKAGKDRLTLVPMEKHDLIFGARQHIHGYVNASDAPITVYIVWTDTPEVSISEYFTEIAKPIFEEPALNVASPSLHVLRGLGYARRYGMNFSKDFWEYASEIVEDKDFGSSNIETLEQLVAESSPL
jgi:hypothetical protein